MTPRAPSIEESVEWVIPRVWLCGRFQEGAIGPNTMLKAEELPAGISCLDTCLAHMDGDALSLKKKPKIQVGVKVPVTKLLCKTQSKTNLVKLFPPDFTVDSPKHS